MHTPDGSPARPTPVSSLTYEPHFGLAEKPFSLSANPKFLYRSPTHRRAFDRLLAGIRRREGLIVLTGEVGTGKTTVCRAVIDALDRRTFSAFVPDPFLTREDLLKAVLVDFGVVSADDIKAGRLQGSSRQDLSHLLYEFLRSIAPLDAFAVVVVDEAQNLALPVLEEIRILTELESGEKLLQVVLVGQPEFRAHLALPEMRQVNQRVSVRAELSPLDADGVRAYVSHRLSVAAHGAPSGVTFALDALDAVWRASGGVPRLINKICDRALEDGHAAGIAAIGPAQVSAALDALDLPAVADAPPAPPAERQASPLVFTPSRGSAPVSLPVEPMAAVDVPPAVTARVGEVIEPRVVAHTPEGDAGLDAFASEPAADVAPAHDRPRELPMLFEPAVPALGRTAGPRQGWLTKLWRASIYVLALAGALGTSGVLDGRALLPDAPLPALPPAPTPRLVAIPTSAIPASVLDEIAAILMTTPPPSVIGVERARSVPPAGPDAAPGPAPVDVPQAPEGPAPPAEPSAPQRLGQAAVEP